MRSINIKFLPALFLDGIKNKLFVFLLSFMAALPAFSQNYHLKATVINFPRSKALLMSDIGGQGKVLDTANVDSQGQCMFEMQAFYKPGIYKLMPCK